MKIPFNQLNVIFVNLVWLFPIWFITFAFPLAIVVLILGNFVFIKSYKLIVDLEGKKYELLRMAFCACFFLHGLSMLFVYISGISGMRRFHVLEFFAYGFAVSKFILIYGAIFVFIYIGAFIHGKLTKGDANPFAFTLHPATSVSVLMALFSILSFIFSLITISSTVRQMINY